MSYHVGRNSQQLGQFTEAQIRDGLDQGTFFTSDLVWGEGMPEWKRMDQVFGFAAASALSAPRAPVIPTMGAPFSTMQPMYGGIPVLPTPGTAIASLVLGIVAIVSVFGCFPGLVLGVPGAICGHMALKMINRSGGQQQGRGLAVAGLATSYAAIALGILFSILIAAVVVISPSTVTK